MVVWSAQTYALLTTATTNQPMHHVKWDPYTVNEFASVGQNGSVLFWLLDETGNDVSLNVHEAEVPEELLQTHHMVTYMACIPPFVSSVDIGMVQVVENLYLRRQGSFIVGTMSTWINCVEYSWINCVEYSIDLLGMVMIENQTH